jgi:tetratricopeptide (TPR) repeat protein
MKRTLVWTALLIATLAGAPRAGAGEWPPEFLVNIQALPGDISVREIRTTMRGFAGSLGVRCTHCHVGDDPNDLRSIDFAADDKIEKRKAREMIRMTRRINEELLAKVPERSDPPVVIQCRTCHRSLTRPVEIRDLLAHTFAAEGAEATIARYQELRDDYYGSDSYDFRPFVLANVAEEVAEQSPEGAIRLLEFNGELHPDSAQTFATMGRIYRAMDDISGAIRSLERALETDPQSEYYRRVLRQLRNLQ